MALITSTYVLPLKAHARLGDWGEPIVISDFPFVHQGNTQPRPPSRIQSYSCAPTLSERGPEVTYQVSLTQTGTLSVIVEGDQGAVDIDVHLLSGAQLNAGLAEGCLARDNEMLEQSLSPGTYLITVDTYAGNAQAGPYTLWVHFAPEGDWYTRPIAEGVTLETKRYDSLFGGVQFGSVLRVDLDVAGVEVRPVEARGCQTTSALAREVGAVAAVNGGFFDGSCASVSLLKIDGALIASNARGRSAFGLTRQGTPEIRWVGAGLDWPNAHHAIGGLSRIARSGAIDVEWERDAASYSFTYQAHPRTAVGIGAGSELIMATLDGRTAAGVGASLFDFGQWLVWLGAEEALNLDGGGSTTLWTTTEGVVSFPSDNGYADHRGERGVASILAIFAPPLARDVEWSAEGGVRSLAVGTQVTFEIFARDPDGAALTLNASTTGSGALDFIDRGDGTGVLSYTPVSSDDDEVMLSVEARAEGRVDGQWSTRISITGNTDNTGGSMAEDTSGGSMSGTPAAGDTSGDSISGATMGGSVAGDSISAGSSAGDVAGDSMTGSPIAGDVTGGSTDAGSRTGAAIAGTPDAGSADMMTAGTERESYPPRNSTGRITPRDPSEASPPPPSMTEQGGVSCAQASTEPPHCLLWLIGLASIARALIQRESQLISR